MRLIGCKSFQDFCERQGNAVAEDVCERICEASLLESGDYDRCRISDTHKYDAINMRIGGTIEVGEKTYGFQAESGNWNGFVMEKWDEEFVEFSTPEPPPRRTFVPKDRSLHIDRPQMYLVYLKWRKEKWFQDKENGLNYDMHFDPCDKTRQSYSKWADSRGLRLARIDEVLDDSQIGADDNAKQRP